MRRTENRAQEAQEAQKISKAQKAQKVQKAPKFFTHAAARLVAAILAFLAISAFASRGEAIPAYPGPVEHTQADGQKITYYQHGDEFLNWLTSARGDLVVFGDDGDLYQARWIDEAELAEALQDAHFRGGVGEDNDEGTVSDFTGGAVVRNPAVSRGVKATLGGGMPAIGMEVPPDYLVAAAAEAAARRDEALAEQRAANAILWNMPSRQRAPANPAKTGKILVIYVRYPNDPAVSGLQLTANPEQFIHNMVFNTANAGSVASFYRDATSGGAVINPADETYGTANDGVVVVDLPGLHGNWQGSDVNGFLNACMVPAYQAAAAYVNFPSFDTNGNGILETSELSIGMIVQGYESAFTPVLGKSIWGMSITFSPTQIVPSQNILFPSVFVQGSHQNVNPLTMGIMAHEMGHNLYGFVDVYDYSYNVNDLGEWSLMAGGSWGYESGNRQGANPSIIDAYNLLLSGIATPDAVLDRTSTGTYTATGSMAIYRVNTNVANQYFLLQPRADEGRDRGMFRQLVVNNPAYDTTHHRRGLLVLHVDENIPNQYESAIHAHPRVSVEEAHGGTRNLMAQRGTGGANTGDLADLFGNKKTGVLDAFTQTTDPNTNQYAGTSSGMNGQTVASGLDITDIESVAPNTVNFTMGGSPPGPQTAWFVKVGGTGSRDASSWDNASGDLSMVMHLAPSGSTIYVAGGTYAPTLNRLGAIDADPKNHTFAINQKSLSLYGGYAPSSTGTSLANRNVWTHKSILDGQNYYYNVMRFHSEVNLQMTVDGFTITNGLGNSASAFRGAGIFMGGLATGHSATVRINDCRFIDNRGNGCGAAVMADGWGTWRTYFTNCTFKGNRATGEQGGALFWDTDAIGPLNVENCTFYDNYTDRVGGAIFTRVPTTITSSTFVGNDCVNSGGRAVQANGSTTIRNSLFFQNGTSGTDIAGSVTDGGYNIFMSVPSGFSLASSSLVIPDAMVDALAYNDGPNETMALLSGSPAIDRIPPGTANVPAADQRGVARPQGIGSDVGAYEGSGGAVMTGTLHPKTITAVAGRPNLIFTVWPSDASQSVPAGTWESSDERVATIAATTPSAGGRPQGRAAAIDFGEATIKYVAPTFEATGTVRVAPQSSTAPATAGYAASSSVANSASFSTFAAGLALQNVASLQGFSLPTPLTVYEYDTSGFAVGSVASNDLQIVGSPKSFEINYDIASVASGTDAALPLAVSLDVPLALSGAVDLDAVFAQYGVYKQIDGRTYDLVDIVRQAGIDMSKIFNIAVDNNGVATIGVKLCIVDADRSGVLIIRDGDEAFLVVYDGKKDWKWSDPIFVARKLGNGAGGGGDDSDEEFTVTVNPERLGTSGGVVETTVSGAALAGKKIQVAAFLNGEKMPNIQAERIGPGSVSLRFPANLFTRSDLTYPIYISTDDGNNWRASTATVVVAQMGGTTPDNNKEEETQEEKGEEKEEDKNNGNIDNSSNENNNSNNGNNENNTNEDKNQNDKDGATDKEEPNGKDDENKEEIKTGEEEDEKEDKKEVGKEVEKEKEKEKEEIEEVDSDKKESQNAKEEGKEQTEQTEQNKTEQDNDDDDETLAESTFAFDPSKWETRISGDAAMTAFNVYVPTAVADEDALYARDVRVDLSGAALTASPDFDLFAAQSRAIEEDGVAIQFGGATQRSEDVRVLGLSYRLGLIRYMQSMDVKLSETNIVVDETGEANEAKSDDTLPSADRDDVSKNTEDDDAAQNAADSGGSCAAGGAGLAALLTCTLWLNARRRQRK